MIVSRPAADPDDGMATDDLTGRVSLANFRRTDRWSLLSLLMSCAALIACVVLIVTLLVRKDKPKGEDGQQHVDVDEPDEGEIEEAVEEERTRRHRLLVLRILSIVAGVLTPVLFLLLDNLRLPMAFINRWTLPIGIVYIVHLVIMIAFIILARKRKVDDPTEEEEPLPDAQIDWENKEDRPGGQDGR